ncbi:AI-2E family transporter [Lysinibacter cavernae]|uniref:Putative PurR-regulated permease PerM n=1 Tax=Lysinibacter cavernae TaxID=1640652 RepID=A0A7X5QZW4_9MICO|nr:AI-2E family transporter [Lysinibacter cavernae]NIH53041.1 putative PurR-regulated permease PerM [Lysinibacter cavernae]
MTESTPPTNAPPTWRDGYGHVATRALQTIIILVLAVGVIYAFIQLKIVVIPVIIALIIASAFSPVLGWMRRRGLPGALAATICLVASVIVIGGVIWLIVTQVQKDWAKLAQQATDGFNEALDWFNHLDLPIDTSKIQEIQDGLLDFVTSGSFATGALSGVAAAGELITSTLLTIVILFFFMKDGPKIWHFMTGRLATAVRIKTDRVAERSVTVLGGYVRGTATVALVDATGIGVALLILQVPLALPLSIIVFIGGFIPIVGATVAGILAALVALVTNGIWGAIIVVAVVILVQQLEGNFLQPVLMGNALKLHPLVILIALTAGTVLGGIIGAILSVPITAVGWAIAKAWFGEDDYGAVGKLDLDDFGENPDVEVLSTEEPPTQSVL